jgi:predicted acetyltransferase
MAAPRYGQPDGNAEMRAYSAICAQAFAGDQQAFEEMIRAFGLDSLRVLRDDDVTGGLTIYRTGQFFGGRSVPTWGIAGVAVAPELRGRGYAIELMREVLREAHAQGAPLSTLYPAAPGLYRSLGWEFAGVRSAVRLRLGELRAPASDVELRPATPDDERAIRDLYRRARSHINGCMDRDEHLWSRVRRAPSETPVVGYIAQRGGEPVGYVLYLQKRETPGHFVYNLYVRDFACAAPGVGEAILAFFARHRSVARELVVYMPPGDPLLANVLGTQEVPVESQIAWMLRIVRVGDALQTRGYSTAIQAEATVNVKDDELPDNSGPWTLQVAQGRMRVERGGPGGPGITVGGLASLYSGFHTPAQLRESGQLTGDTAHDAALQAMFAGPLPWMPDFF